MTLINTAFMIRLKYKEAKECRPVVLILVLRRAGLRRAVAHVCILPYHYAACPHL